MSIISHTHDIVVWAFLSNWLVCNGWERSAIDKIFQELLFKKGILKKEKHIYQYDHKFRLKN